MSKKFTRVEIEHLLGLLHKDKREGCYTGVKEHYYKRTDVLIARFTNLLKEQTNDKR